LTIKNKNRKPKQKKRNTKQKKRPAKVENDFPKSKRVRGQMSPKSEKSIDSQSTLSCTYENRTLDCNINDIEHYNLINPIKNFRTTKKLSYEQVKPSEFLIRLDVRKINEAWAKLEQSGDNDEV
jgi:hypothetical protein